MATRIGLLVLLASVIAMAAACDGRQRPPALDICNDRCDYDDTCFDDCMAGHQARGYRPMR